VKCACGATSAPEREGWCGTKHTSSNELRSPEIGIVQWKKPLPRIVVWRGYLTQHIRVTLERTGDTDALAAWVWTPGSMKQPSGHLLDRSEWAREAGPLAGEILAAYQRLERPIGQERLPGAHQAG